MMLSSLSGKIAFCVGSTSGIGRGIAKRLALLQANVVIVSNNPSAAKATVNELKAINSQGSYEVINCDFASMKSLHQACDDFGKTCGKLNYLVMSQDSTAESRKETSEGINERMALHYYGRLQCIRSLESTLKQTAATEEVRVMSVLSAGSHRPYDKLSDLGLKKNNSLMHISDAAGFYTDLAFDQLGRDFGQCNVSFIHADPGFVKSDGSEETSLTSKFLSGIGNFFSIPIEECAENLVDRGLIAPRRGPDAAGFAGCHLIKFNGSDALKTRLHNSEYRNAVWGHTIETLDGALRSHY